MGSNAPEFRIRTKRFAGSSARRLVGEIERLQPFPDALAALERLGRRYRLAVFSNGDPDMLENARPHIGFAFEAMIGAAEAGYFKPHSRSYRHAAERLGVAPAAVMHVANHAFDGIGAKATGLRAAFVNRRRRPFEDTPYRPDLTVFSLEELADCLA